MLDGDIAWQRPLGARAIAIPVVMDTDEIDDTEDRAVVMDRGYASPVPHRKVAKRVLVGFESGVDRDGLVRMRRPLT